MSKNLPAGRGSEFCQFGKKKVDYESNAKIPFKKSHAAQLQRIPYVWFSFPRKRYVGRKSLNCVFLPSCRPRVVLTKNDKG